MSEIRKICCCNITMSFILFIQLCCVLGLVVSLYFVALYKGLIKGTPGLVPRKFCRKNTCADLLKTPFTRLFKVPNFYLGIVYYLLILYVTLFMYPYWLGVLLLLASLFVVGVSVYLLYCTQVKLHTFCLLCMVAHVVNVIIGVYFVMAMVRIHF